MDFDVPTWLASIVGCARGEVVYLDEASKHDSVSVQYERAGQLLAVVNLAALPLGIGGGATWQVVAQLDDRVERAEVPAKTRFIWR